jgi:hypothetical protein
MPPYHPHEPSIEKYLLFVHIYSRHAPNAPCQELGQRTGWQEFQHSQQWMDTLPKGMNLLPNLLPVQTDTVTHFSCRAFKFRRRGMNAVFSSNIKW